MCERFWRYAGCLDGIRKNLPERLGDDLELVVVVHPRVDRLAVAPQVGQQTRARGGPGLLDHAPSTFIAPVRGPADTTARASPRRRQSGAV